MAPQLVELSEKQLHKLAELIHRQEVQKLYEIKFESYEEQQKYLNSCKQAYHKTDNLLKAVRTMKDETEEEKDAAKISIAHDIFEYSRSGINTALQFIRSYNTRITFLDKLSAHSHDMMNLLRTLNPATQIDEARRLTEQACIYKDYMLKYAKKMQGFVPNQFTRWFKESGMTVENLLRKYMTKLGFEGSFQKLPNVQKLQVYEAVAEAAGRGRTVVTYTTKALGAVGVVVLIFSAATMVWDICTAENKFEVATRDAMNVFLGSVASITVDRVATVAVAAGFRALSIEVASGVITVMGSVVGIGVGVIIGIAAGALLDSIFMSGTTAVSATDGLTICRVAPMPNGLELARLVKYYHPDV